MDRRGFMLGTLAGGITFFLEPVIESAVIPCKSKLTSIERHIRLLKLQERQLKNCKILLLTDVCDGPTFAPKIDSVEIDRETCYIKFWCQELEFKQNIVFNGCQLIDDLNQKVRMSPSYLDNSVNLRIGDRLKFNYALTIGD